MNENQENAQKTTRTRWIKTIPCLDGHMLMQTRYMIPNRNINMAVIQLDSDAPIAGLNGQRNYHNNHQEIIDEKTIQK